MITITFDRIVGTAVFFDSDLVHSLRVCRGYGNSMTFCVRRDLCVKAVGAISNGDFLAGRYVL